MNIREFLDSKGPDYTLAQGYADLTEMTQAMLGGVEGAYRNGTNHPAFVSFTATIDPCRDIYEDLLEGQEVDRQMAADTITITRQYTIALGQLPRKYQTTDLGGLARQATSLSFLLSAWALSLV